MRKQTWNMLLVGALLCPALLIVGCKGDGGTVVDDDGVALAQPITIVERVNGDSAVLKTIGAMHIATQDEYDDLGDADLFPGGVDFTKYDLVIVALGEQATGGYSVEIESIQLDGSELAVTGKATTPGPDAVTTQALSYPYSAAVIANTAADTVVPYID